MSDVNVIKPRGPYRPRNAVRLHPMRAPFANARRARERSQRFKELCARSRGWEEKENEVLPTQNN